MKKIISLLIATAFVAACFAGCTGGGNNTGTGSDTTGSPAEETLPVLKSITIDGGYSVDFKGDVNEYSVSIPAGRPEVPHVSAEGDGEIEIIQAVIPDDKTSGTATLKITADGKTNVYKVTFNKDAKLGYYMQYADIYKYKPDYKLASGEKFTYESSDKNVLYVDKSGYVEAKRLSDTPVTVNALVDGKVVDTLTVDKIIKAPLNIFFIIGQSNAFGWHDVPSGINQNTYFKEQKAQFDMPVEGTVFGDEVTTSYDEYTFSGMRDLASTKGYSGFFPALGKEWYALTGEKTLMLKSAVGSSPIEAWTPDESLKFFGIDLYKMTVEKFNEYKAEFEAEDSKYKINRIYAYWLQGETCEEYVYDPSEHTWADKKGIKNYKYLGDWSSPSKAHPLMTADEYYNYFMQMYYGLVKDCGLEFMGILPVRAMLSVSSAENKKSEQLVDLVAPRCAQFAINYLECGNIQIVTLLTEIGRTEAYADQNAEGWGYLGCNNIHYQQRGYNAIGKDSALNTFNMFYSDDKKSTDIRILDTNGSDYINDGDKIRVELGTTYQISAVSLPIYTEAHLLTFEIADTNVCTIDKYGLLKASSDNSMIGKTTELTISNGTISKTITIVVS